MFPPVFIPEKQTECIVDFALSKITPSTKKVLELGCGTGAIILSLAKICKQVILLVRLNREGILIQNDLNV